MNGKFNPAIHHRRSIRLKGYDYTRPGAYYVTICLQEKDSRLLGEVSNGKVLLSHFGEIVWKCWKQLPRHYPNVKLDEFVVMPNHVHGVIWLVNPGECAEGVGAGLQNRNYEDVKPARTADNADDPNIFENANDSDISDDGHDAGDGRLIVAGLMGGVIAEGNRMSDGRGKKYPLPEIVRGFKTFSARRINELRGIAGVPIWQRNYWEHIVRDEDELRRIREYIVNNPMRWMKDKLNSVRS